MTLVELQRALRQLRCSGMAAGLEGRLLQAQAETLAPIDFLSTLVQDELLKRQDRLLERRLKQAGFRDAGKTLDRFDFEFNKKMNRRSSSSSPPVASSPSGRTGSSSVGPSQRHNAHLVMCVILRDSAAPSPEFAEARRSV